MSPNSNIVPKVLKNVKEMNPNIPKGIPTLGVGIQ
jgi:hypothetical protein